MRRDELERGRYVMSSSSRKEREVLNGIRCPHCRRVKASDAIESRGAKDSIRRRRVCECDGRFTKCERVQDPRVQCVVTINIIDDSGRVKKTHTLKLQPGKELLLRNDGEDVRVVHPTARVA